MIAPKRAVMIDNLSRTVLDDIAHPGPEQTAHPSESACVRPKAKRRTKSQSRDRAVRESGRITCCSCRITYLPTAVPPLKVVPEDWVCFRAASDLGDVSRHVLRRKLVETVKTQPVTAR
jgi:hypothetical protein